jgi:nucleoside-diphosphate-sugar epimerase
MEILLTGVTGYIAQRLLPVLLKSGHEVICCVSDKNRFNNKYYGSSNLKIIEADFLDKENLKSIQDDIDAAYYQIHSMATAIGDFEKMEKECTYNFKVCINQTNAKQVIYLSGIFYFHLIA